jgi:hypothetical protein
LNYLYRGEKLIIELHKGRYAVSNSRFKINSTEDFGFNAVGNKLEYFHSRSDSSSLSVQVPAAGKLTIGIKEWNHDKYTWEQTATDNKDKLVYKLNRLKPSHQYQILIDGQVSKTLSSGAHGDVEFSVPIKNNSSSISIQPR